MKNPIKNYNSFLRNNLRKSRYVTIYENFNGESDMNISDATNDTIEKLNFTRQWIMSPTRNFIFIKDILDNLNVNITSSIGGHPIDTMATDGVNLFINPVFGSKLSQDEFTFVIIHEIMHNQWEHFFRKPDIDSKISPAMQHTLWNIATDLEINPIISDIKDIVPLESGLFFDKPIRDAGGYTFDSKVWTGHTADDMFNKLVEIMEDQEGQEGQENQEGEGPQENSEIEIGSIIYDKESGAYGKVTSIDEGGDYEIEEMTRDAVQNELQNI
jgi:hypothetical protein